MAYTNPLTLDPAAFRLRFPLYSANPPYSDAVLQGWWDVSINYISNINCGDLVDDGRTLALQLMMAHLIALGLRAATGAPAGVVTGATIDKVTVSLQPPPGTNAWTYWLNQTPYGQQLLALLSVRAAGGFYVGGAPERAAFRRVGGGFGGGIW